jgi:hypothetical protein
MASLQFLHFLALGIGLKPFGVPTYVDYTSYYSSPADPIILRYDSGLPSFGARSSPNPNPNPNSNSNFNPSSIFFSLNSALQPAYDDFASYFSDDSDIYDEEGAVGKLLVTRLKSRPDEKFLADFYISSLLKTLRINLLYSKRQMVKLSEVQNPIFFFT